MCGMTLTKLLLLQGENWKLISGNDTLVLKFRSVYLGSCHYSFSSFFSWGRDKMSPEFHSFKIQVSQVQSSTGSCWAQWIFPTITTTISFGIWRFGSSSCRITSLVISYLIQLLMKSRGIFLLISVRLCWVLCTFNRSFHCINNVGFAIVLIFYLLCCQIFQIEEYS